MHFAHLSFHCVGGSRDLIQDHCNVFNDNCTNHKLHLIHNYATSPSLSYGSSNLSQISSTECYNSSTSDLQLTHTKLHLIRTEPHLIHSELQLFHNWSSSHPHWTTSHPNWVTYHPQWSTTNPQIIYILTPRSYKSFKLSHISSTVSYNSSITDLQLNHTEL